MTLEQLRIFLSVAELCHVTRAAERLNLTQSAVSAAIATLERQYDVKLFDRIGRGIVLTEAGQLLIDAGQKVMDEASSARALMLNLSQEPRGALRIWASQTIVSYWLTPRMMTMHRAWPLVDMSLHPGNTQEVAQAVVDGTADVGFIEGGMPSSDLRIRKVGHDELVLVLPRNHPLARKPRLDADDYRSLQWLLREPGSGTRMVMEQHLKSMGLSVGDLRVLLQLPTNEAILGGIRSGNCIAMLSWRSMRLAHKRAFAVRRVTWADKPRRNFSVLTDPRRFRTRAMTAFLDTFAI
ncbi:LysR family transcriptional regulator [Puniceibacterium sp. IMCC21224]|uniref:LysR family transcriptional regulator n=1 Tax=Puniceibacterium sp. IMCC21224 TaxID=1618204 RepID=UPI00064DDDE5|nr:LysR family transcriptional regulator [Puniceibacterium sp. IMCC21224]KMK65882.1 transcriptional regulator [Puniceibacterium sp. IMCC21224]